MLCGPVSLHLVLYLSILVLCAIVMDELTNAAHTDLTIRGGKEHQVKVLHRPCTRPIVCAHVSACVSEWCAIRNVWMLGIAR